ncbi:hypothetical protein CVT24_012052 [Panaeolus cyanescens]|uniref:Heme haloperoxidase family profile domain-containing protein n=1 Tax=Panaeolus cyanescens TaxID=181874 RepID=A0A409VHX2_9AGAR|nr:hypothetical protein CVT24_012052 [Panaeolus cyanescens]
MLPKLLSFVFLGTLFFNSALAFPKYASLAGLPRGALDNIVPKLPYRPPETPPGPLKDTRAKLVNDKKHPWKPLRRGDIRGPCPGLNTLASHGYLPRDGIATPAQIMLAVQEGFNMDFGTALLVTYAAHLVDGNVVTNLLSIGGKSPKTGPDPPPPAIVGGLNTHSVFEGDASLTRGDDFFGDNHSFNKTLFQQLVDASNKYGGGKYNLTVAAEFRHQRIQESIATNPKFDFTSPRFFTAFAETTFPINFFIDGRNENGQLDLDVARSFFQHSRYPDGFFRPSSPRGAQGLDVIFAAHPIQPGRNVDGVNNYVPDPTSADFDTFCLLYTNFVNKTIKGLYPNPTGVLRKALNWNLNILYLSFKDSGCIQEFPMFRSLFLTVFLGVLLGSPVLAFPVHASLAGLPRQELDRILPGLTFRPPVNPTPGPLNDTSAKLVNDAAHPWKPLRFGDIRGPCPGLNTLASHGWLPRNGIATPSQIMLAVQEGFNMDFGTALLVTYAAFIVDGNVVTNLLSIGGKTLRTGIINPPPPAKVGGLDTHAVFEGDSSMTRGDAFFGNNHSFNETLFQEATIFHFSGELRHRRIQDSIATNPEFSFVSPRFFTAFAESTFPINFFIDGRNENGQLDMDVARGFFQHSRMPDGFFRPSSPRGPNGIEKVFLAHPIAPGRNVGGVNNYVPDPTSADFSNLCLLYTNFVNQTVTSLYPNPTGALRQALNFNLNILFQAFKGRGCTQLPSSSQFDESVYIG